jgi:hypothetical protein
MRPASRRKGRSQAAKNPPQSAPLWAPLAAGQTGTPWRTPLPAACRSSANAGLPPIGWQASVTGCLVQWARGLTSRRAVGTRPKIPFVSRFGTGLRLSTGNPLNPLHHPPPSPLARSRRRPRLKMRSTQGARLAVLKRPRGSIRLCKT